MISANAALTGSYDDGEVARSVLIAIAASYAALDLTGRVTAAAGRTRLAWLSGGATAMGIGIWAMHFKGMLAFHLPVPVKYHWPTVLASLLVAIFASAVALYVTSRHKMDRVEALTGSVLMGAGIASMHYIGMAAMRLPAVTRFSPLLVTCSIVLAILFSLIALLLAFGLREETRWSVPRRLGSAIVMGVAVSAMHYTGMAAASFIPAAPPGLFHAVSVPPFANYGVFIATLIVLVAAIATSSVDRRASAEIQQLNQDLERRVGERTVQIEMVNQSLRKEIAERERAEDAVRQSEEHLRLVIDTTPAMIHSARPDGYLDFFNKRWLEYLGVSLDDLLGWRWTSVIHPDDLAQLVDRWQTSLATGKPFDAEARLRRADGEYRLTLHRKVPLRDETGNIVKWYGSIIDIEDRKRAEKELKSSEEKSRVIVEAASDAVISMDESGSIQFANAATARVFGHDPAELIGKPLTVLMPDYLRKLHEVGFRRYLATGERHLNWQGAEVTALRKNGQEFPVEVSFGEMISNGHKGFTGFIRDISEKKRAEDELRKQKEVFQKIFENIPVIIVLRGQDRRIELVNPEFERVMGWTLKETRGQNLELYATFFPDPDYRQMALDLLAASTGEWNDLKVSVKDGRVIDVAAIFLRLSDGSTLGIGQDITERKRAEAALQEAHADLARVTRMAAMGELAAAIAHEVNQPLGAVVTYGSASLRWLGGQPPNLEEAREAIERTVREATRASDVIGRIRALLQKGLPQMERLDVNTVIREVLILAGSELLKGGVTVRTELAADVPAVLGDRVQLQQVLLNLILNGVDAMSSITDRPRDLLVRSSRHLEGVLIQVHDSGVGVDPGQAGHIFEPFFTTKPQGIGMGLSVGRSIVEAHGGRLWFTPGPSHGAFFQFTLAKAE
jgi:PAS domain S-box-containing protein